MLDAGFCSHIVIIKAINNSTAIVNMFISLELGMVLLGFLCYGNMFCNQHRISLIHAYRLIVFSIVRKTVTQISSSISKYHLPFVIPTLGSLMIPNVIIKFVSHVICNTAIACRDWNWQGVSKHVRHDIFFNVA